MALKMICILYFFMDLKQNDTYVESTVKGPVGELLYDNHEMVLLARMIITFSKFTL